jgi:hypothetical protein
MQKCALIDEPKFPLPSLMNSVPSSVPLPKTKAPSTTPEAFSFLSLVVTTPPSATAPSPPPAGGYEGHSNTSMAEFFVSPNNSDCTRYPCTHTATSIPSTDTYTPHSNSLCSCHRCSLSPGRKSGTKTQISGLIQTSQPESIPVLPQVPCTLFCIHTLHWMLVDSHIPSHLVVKRVSAHRKPPEVRIWRLRNQSRVGTVPPSTSTPQCPACWARHW